MAYQITPALEKSSWDLKLRKESLLVDIYSDFAGISDKDSRAVPSGIFIRYTETNGATTHTLPLLKELNGSGGTGRDRARGTEEDQVTRHLKVYANAWFHTVSKEEYGVDHTASKYLNLMSQITPQLGRWTAQRKGRYIRQALCQVFSDNLVDAPTSLTQGINPNVVFIGGASSSTKNLEVTYSATLATFITNIQSQATAIGTPNSSNRMNLDSLNQIMLYATEHKKLEPLVMNGQNKYMLTMPGRQKNFLMDPTATTSLFNLLKEADVRGSNKALKYEMYEYGSLLLVVDPRAPQVVITGGTVTFAYADVGDVDNRSQVGAATRFDVCILHGNQCVYEYVTEPQHFKEDSEDYDRFGGVGSFQVSGFQLTKFDGETPTDTSMHQRYSALFLAGTL